VPDETVERDIVENCPPYRVAALISKLTHELISRHKPHVEPPSTACERDEAVERHIAQNCPPHRLKALIGALIDKLIVAYEANAEEVSTATMDSATGQCDRESEFPSGPTSAPRAWRTRSRPPP
jgi:hypothetical protein